jgi:hypothetical protein
VSYLNQDASPHVFQASSRPDGAMAYQSLRPMVLRIQRLEAV